MSRGTQKLKERREAAERDRLARQNPEPEPEAVPDTPAEKPRVDELPEERSGEEESSERERNVQSPGDSEEAFPVSSLLGEQEPTEPGEGPGSDAA